MSNFYFSNKGKITFEKQEIDDLFFNFKIDDRYYREGYFFLYRVPDDERIELTAYNIYGNQMFWWLILLYNKKINPFFDWPMDSFEIEEYAKKESERLYGGGYSEDQFGSVIDELFSSNEEKKLIKLPNNTAAQEIMIQFINSFKV